MNADPSTEVFVLNPYDTNINPSLVEGGNLCMKEVQELPASEKLKTFIESMPKIRNHLEDCRSKFAWRLLHSKVPDDNGDAKDFIKNFRAVSKENVLAFNNEHLGNGQNTVPLADRELFALDVANNNDHKIQFFMIAQVVQGHFDQLPKSKLLTNKNNYAWCDNNVDIF